MGLLVKGLLTAGVGMTASVGSGVGCFYLEGTKEKESGSLCWGASKYTISREKVETLKQQLSGLSEFLKE